jgi:hypothetical protein
MQLLTSFSFLNLYLHTGNSRAIEAQWRGFVSSQFLREAISTALHLARQHQITGWIADDRKLGPVRPADLEWIGSTALPILAELGLKRFAVIEAEDPMNKLLINRTAEEATPALPFEYRRFTNVQAARAWACELQPATNGN